MRHSLDEFGDPGGLEKMRKILLSGLCGSAFLIAGDASAVVIGTEPFTYPDGPIGDKAGGTGWNVVRTAEAGSLPVAPSDWDNVGGTPNVTSNMLVTLGTSAKREYAGATEGSGAGANEREGAFRSAGAVFYRVDLTRAAGADWSGASSYDFGNERIFFGVPGGQTVFGIEESGVGTTLSSVQAVTGQTHTIVAMLDFDSDTLALWVDPAAGALPNVTRAYTGTNWSSAVRLGSGGTGSTTWDNLTVANSAADVGVSIPEPATLGMLVLGGMPFVMRRRRQS
jgi:hypothetical protein